MWWSKSFTLLFILLSRSLGEIDLCPCPSISEKQLTRQPSQFSEGANVTINFEGDKNGRGCQFFHKKDKNVTCCYIHKSEEDKRSELCGTPTQHQSCRERKTYDIEEIDGRIGECTLTLYNAVKSDSGFYEIVFPAAPKYNTGREVEVVKGVLLYVWEWLLIVIIGSISISFLSVYFCYLKPQLVQKEKHQREKDEIILDKFKNNNIDGFEKSLTNRNLFGLRDKNDNNIIHIAAAKSEWSEQMINIVLNPQEQDTESLNDQGEKSFRRLSSKLFLMSKWIPNIFPYYLVPDCMMHLNISLDSKNSAGDTPLIIAAKQNRIEVVRVLLKKEVKINIKRIKC